jgi:hypothetical protein
MEVAEPVEGLEEEELEGVVVSGVAAVVVVAALALVGEQVLERPDHQVPLTH